MAREQRPPPSEAGVAPPPCCLPLWAALGWKWGAPAKRADGEEHAQEEHDESQEQVDGFKDGTSPASTVSHESRRSWVSGLVARLRGQTIDGTPGAQSGEEDDGEDGGSKKGRKVRFDQADGDGALESPGSSLSTSTGGQEQEGAEEGEQQGAQQRREEEAPAVVQETATSHYINQEVEAAPSVDAVLELVAAEAQVFTATNCTNALTRISRLGVRDHNSALRLARDARFRSLLQTAAQHMEDARSGFGPSQQIQFLLAFARLGLQPEAEMLAHLQRRIEGNVGSYRCVELAGLLTAMVRLVSSSAAPAAGRAKPTQDRDALIIDGISAPEAPVWPPTPLLQVLEAQAVDSLAGGHGTGSMACNIYCSLCSLGHAPSQQLTWGLATRLLELDLQSVDSHWLAQTLNWMGRHGVEPGQDFMFAARDEILRRMHDLPAVDLAMCVSAMGKLRPPPGEFFHRTLLNHVGKRLQAFGSPQALALLINGLGNLNAAAAAAGAGGLMSPPGQSSPKNGGKGALLISPKLLTGLLDLAATRLHKFKPTELANVLSGLAKLKVRPSTVFFLRTSAIVEARLDEFTPADLANVVYGMVRMKFHPTEQLVAAIYAWSDAILTMVEPRVERRRGGWRHRRHSRRHHHEEAEAEAEADELAEKQAGAAKVEALDLAYMLNVFVQLHLGGPDHGTMARVRDALMRPSASSSREHGEQGEQQQPEEESEASSQEEQLSVGPTSLLARASIRSLSMIMWVFSRYEHYPGADFLEAVAETAFGGRGREEGGEDEDGGALAASATSEAALQTTVLLQSLFRLGYVPTEGQLQGAMALLAPCLEELSPKTLFNTLYALAKWGAAPGESTAGQTFFEAWSSHAPRRFIPALTMPQLVVTAWALKTMGYRATTEVELGFRETLAVRSLTAMTDSEASSLAHSLQEIGVDVSASACLLRKKANRDARPSPASGAGGVVARAQAAAAKGRASKKPGAAAAVGKRGGQQRQRAMRKAPTYRSGRLVEDDGGVAAGAELDDDDGNEDVMNIAMM